MLTTMMKCGPKNSEGKHNSVKQFATRNRGAACIIKNSNTQSTQCCGYCRNQEDDVDTSSPHIDQNIFNANWWGQQSRSASWARSFHISRCGIANCCNIHHNTMVLCTFQVWARYGRIGGWSVCSQPRSHWTKNTLQLLFPFASILLCLTATSIQSPWIEKEITSTFSSKYWAFGPTKKIPIVNLIKMDNKIEKSSESFGVDMSPSLIASIHRLCDLCMCWIMKNHTHTDDAQTKHKKSVRLCFCVLWKAPNDTKTPFVFFKSSRFCRYATALRGV